MPKFKLYAGLGGGFGGAHYHGTYEFNDHAEAEHDAYQLAIEEYESYGGHHGLYTWDSLRQEIADDYYDGDISKVDVEDVDMAYTEEVEGWIVYYAKEVDETLDWCSKDEEEED